MIRQTRLLCTVLVVLMLPITYPVDSKASGPIWPPTAWVEGDFDAISTESLMMLASGVDPGSPDAPVIRFMAKDLAMRDPKMQEAVRVMLLGYVEAMWWQTEAGRGHPDAMGTPRPNGSSSGVGVDQLHAARGAEALAAAVSAVVPIVAAPPEQRLSAALREALADAGHTVADARVVPYSPLQALDTTLWAADAAPGLEDGMAALLASLDAMATGASIEKVLTLTHALDAVAEDLQALYALALLRELAPTPVTSLPDPGSPVPPVAWGRNQPTVRIAQAVDGEREMLGLVARLAPGHVVDQGQLDGFRALPASTREAIGRIFGALNGLIDAQAQRPAPVPDLEAWLGRATDASYVPDARERAQLLALVPTLETYHARNMAASQVSQAIAAFATSASIVPQTPGCSQRAEVSFVLAFDSCGTETTWSGDHLLLFDVGGDDVYHSRLGAPFLVDPATLGPMPPGVPETPIAIPFNIAIDLGGSDSYETTADCAQGAACPFLARAAQDPTNLARHAPLSVLIDWDWDNVTRENRFSAGDNSQGFNAALQAFSPIGGVNSGITSDERSLGLLIERVGNNSTLVSHYTAGDRAQGSAANDQAPPVAAAGGHGHLIRVLGDDAFGQGTFAAGHQSQGASAMGQLNGVRAGAYSQGVFVNIAGSRSVSHDAYTAGQYAQAALDPRGLGSSIAASTALFADVSGPGGGGNDTYYAETKSRGFSDVPASPTTTTHQSRAWFIDATLPERAPATAGLDGGLPGRTLVLAPGVTADEASRDHYAGPIAPGQGYGWAQIAAPAVSAAQRPPTMVEAGFFDLGGDDAYDLHELLWRNAGDEARPRNDAAWQGGRDVAAHDSDRDGYPAFLESLWPFWNADPDRQEASPGALRDFISLEENRDQTIDGAWNIVVTLGGDTVYGPDFSARLVIDVAGDDLVLGRAGAAGGIGSDPGSQAGALHQHGVSVHVDFLGDDRYISASGRDQGYGEAGGIGVLIDGSGSDWYQGPGGVQGATGLAGTEGIPSVGILLDLGVKGAGESNIFWAGQGSQGHAAQPQDVALIAATGDHNGFSDGVSGDGRSINLGSNAPPTISSLRWLGPEGEPTSIDDVRAGVDYILEVNATDADGDAFLICIQQESGEPGRRGAVTSDTHCESIAPGSTAPFHHTLRWDRTRQVHTTAGSNAAVRYNLTVEASDIGGASSPPMVLAARVHHAPPVITSALDAATIVQGQATRHQIQYGLNDPAASAQVVIDWGDGSLDSGGLAALDWASALGGASIFVPDAVPRAAGALAGSRAGVEVIGNSLRHAIDGDPETAARFRFDPFDYPPIHAFVTFEGAKHVEVLEFDLATSSPVNLSIELIRDDGSIAVVDRLDLSPGRETSVVPVPDAGAYEGIILRQLIPANRTGLLPVTLDVYAARALGPGGAHAWQQPGEFTLNVTVIDDVGGAAHQTATIRVIGITEGTDESEVRNGIIPGLGLQLIDAFGAGPVREVGVAAASDAQWPGSLASDPRARELVLLGQGGAWLPCDQGGRCLEIDWGDGSPVARIDMPSGGMRVAVPHLYRSTGTFEVVASTIDGGVLSASAPVARAHVEDAFDLTAADEAVLWVSMDTRDSWHSNRAHRILVDAGGDDRYFGAYGGTRATNVNGIIADQITQWPAVLVDVAGDDTYVASSHAHGSASAGSAAVFYDGGGDDFYVTGSHGQGAATRQGTAVFWDGGGDDAFNMLGVEHPWILDAVPTAFEPWAASDGKRPSSWAAGVLASAPTSMTLLQGASIDGLALFAAVGGTDRLRAGGQSQAFASHQETNLMGYALRAQKCSLDPETVNPWVAECITGVNLGPTLAPGCSNFALPCIPDLYYASEWLREGGRYGAALAVHHNTGFTTAFMADEGQGYAQHGGRALFMLGQGAGDLQAGERAQAAAIGGNAVFMGLGPQRLDVAADGHGWTIAAPSPEGLPSTAIILGPAGDRHCTSGCPATPTGAAVPHTGIAPTLSWREEAFATGGALRYDDTVLPIQVDGSVSAAGLGVEALVTGSVFVLGPDGCTTERLAPPRVIAQATGPPGAFDMPLLQAATGIGGPVLPAGCVELRVFARYVGSGDQDGGWASLHGGLTWLPSRALLNLGPSDLTGSQAIEVVLAVEEPLPAMAQSAGQVDIWIESPAGREQAQATPLGDWALRDEAGRALAVRPYRIDTSALGGSYDLSGAFHFGAAAHEQPLGRIHVDDGVVAVAAVQPPPAFHRPARPMVVTLDVGDIAGVASTQGRLVSDRPECRVQDPAPDCLVEVYSLIHLIDSRCEGLLGQWNACIVETVPSFPPGNRPTGHCPSTCRLEPPIGSGDASTTPIVEASLRPLDPAVRTARAQLVMVPSVPFEGGGVLLHVRVVDGGGQASPWLAIDQGGLDGMAVATPIAIDSRAPERPELRVGASTGATNATHPVRIDVEITDCLALATCGQGAGVEQRSIGIFVRDHVKNTIEPLSILSTAPTAAGGLAATVVWEGDERGPPEGRYEFVTQAFDRAGNLMVENPGSVLIIDRAPPVLRPSGFQVTLPEGQSAVKPGDLIRIAVAAEDQGQNPSGIANVTARYLDEVVALQADTEPGTFAGTLIVPETASGDAAVQVRAVDGAGNAVRVAPAAVPFFPTPPTITDVQTRVRSETADISFASDRPLNISQAVFAGIVDQAGQRLQSADGFTIRFAGLTPNASYEPVIILRDAAGYVVDLSQEFGSVLTPARSSTAFTFDPLPGTYSGTPEARLRVDRALQSNLRVESHPRGILSDIPVSPAATQWISIPVDTRALLGPDSVGQIMLNATLDDGASLWHANITIRVDNRVPLASMEAPETFRGHGWGNASTVLRVAAVDDTSPITTVLRIDGNSKGEPNGFTLSQEGIHTVVATVADGAIPPNVATLEVVRRIDKTPPDLAVSDFTRFIAGSWMNGTAVITDAEGGSGPEDLRVLTASGPLTSWLAPGAFAVNVSALDEGSHALVFEARDRAGNRQGAIHQLTIDRTPPRVLAMQWLQPMPGGWTLEFAATDRGTAGDGSGVKDVRWVGTGSEGPWTPLPANALLEIPDDGTLLMLRDQAGNVATSPLPARPERAFVTAPGDEAPIQGGHVIPAQGTSADNYTFSAWVFMAPEAIRAVHLVFNGASLPMQPDAPDHVLGAVRFTLTMRLPPSGLGADGTFQVVVETADGRFESQAWAGPLVVAADEPLASGGPGKQSPGLGIMTLVGAVLLAIRRRP